MHWRVWWREQGKIDTGLGSNVGCLFGCQSAGILPHFFPGNNHRKNKGIQFRKGFSSHYLITKMSPRGDIEEFTLLNPGHILARASIYSNFIACTDKIRHIYFITGFGGDFLRYTCSSIAFYRWLGVSYFQVNCGR